MIAARPVPPPRGRGRVTQLAAAALVAVITTTACSAGPGPNPPVDTGAGSSAGATPSLGEPTAASTDATATARTTPPGPPGATGSGAPAAYPPVLSVADAACVDTTVAAMSEAQRMGQLFMVGLQPGQAPTGLDAAIRTQHLGAVIYLGGWRGGADRVGSVSTHLQGVSGGTVGLLIAADQEGGAVQQLSGTGFTAQPRAIEQGRQSRAALTARATLIGRELRAAGVNVDLAPVADTVPASMTTRNQPIGRWGRHYATEPADVATAAAAVVTGLQSQGVIATLKHFPGLGRVSGNTDLTAHGITDEVATVEDPHLEPFRAGIAAGAGMVMVSSARYPGLDQTHQAVFSRAVVTDLLRGRLGWRGVVVTDDVGSAKAVAAVPVGERAVRFLAAGGDLVLTAQPSQLPTMLAAVRARAGTDPGFAAAVSTATHRVVELKVRAGLVRCG